MAEDRPCECSFCVFGRERDSSGQHSDIESLLSDIPHEHNALRYVCGRTSRRCQVCQMRVAEGGVRCHHRNCSFALCLQCLPLQVDGECWDSDQFVDQERCSEFQCVLCHNICKQIVELECGHAFGQQCVQQLLRSQLAHVCPLCQRSFNAQQVHPNRYLRNKILSFDAHCARKGSGCDFRGMLAGVIRHQVKDCLYRRVTCSQASCRSEFPLVSQPDHHQNHCLLPCPDPTCRQRLPYKELPAHVLHHLPRYQPYLAQYQQLESKYSQLEQRCKELEQERQRFLKLRAQLESKCLLETTLQHKCSQLEQRCKELEHSNRKLEQERQNFLMLRAHFKSQMQPQYESRIASLQKKCGELEQKLQQQSRELPQPESQPIEKIEQEVQDMQPERKEKRNEMENESIDIASIGSVAHQLSVFDHPTSCSGLAIASGHLYLTDSKHHVLDIIHAVTGTRVARWGTFQQSGQAFPHHSPRFNHPLGVAVDEPRGRLYVADSHNHCVVVLRLADGSVEAVWGGQGARKHQFLYPHALALAPAASLLYVVDYNNCVKAVQVSDGKCVQVLGTGLGKGPDQMDRPQGVAVDNDCVYIVDAGNDRVVVYSQQDGRFLRQLGQGRGVMAGQFIEPMSACVDSRSGLLYVADYYNHRVSVWRISDGSFVRQMDVFTSDKIKAHPLSVMWHAETSVLYVTVADSRTICVNTTI